MDSTLIGKTTAEFMETLEESYQHDDDAEVIEVMVIALVDSSRDIETGEVAEYGFTTTHYRSSEHIWTHKVGMLASVQKALDRDREED